MNQLEKLGRPVEWSRPLEADGRPVPAPARSLGPRVGPAYRRIEVDVDASDHHRTLGHELACEEPVPEEMTLARLAVLSVNPPRIAAVELAHPVRETAARPLDHEVMMVQYEGPRRRLPLVLGRDAPVHREKPLVLIGRPEKRSSVTAARPDVVVTL